MTKMCLYYGCKRLASGDTSYCATHAQEGIEAKTRKDNERQRFESGRTWRAIRKSFLMRYPLCYDCELQGDTTMAHEVHHIDNDHTNNLETNLMALCTTHHSKRTNAERKGGSHVNV